MKVKIKNLEPNPYRNMEAVPIERDKVEILKTSIKDYTFWGGLMARPKNNNWDSGKYELAFGHHRLVAVQELSMEEIDITISEIEDANMVRMMVTENMTQGEMTQEVMIGTIREVKEFLDNELAKYKTWDTSVEIIRCLFESQKAFESTKGRGVGRETILKFLKDSIESWRVGSALNSINKEDIGQKAAQTFKTTGQAEGFKRVVRRINAERKEPLPKAKVEELADKVSSRFKKEEGKAVTGSRGGGNYYNQMEGIVRQELNEDDEFTAVMRGITSDLGIITNDSKKLTQKIAGMNGKFHTMELAEIKSFQTVELLQNFTELIGSIQVLAKYLGLKINN